MSACHTLSWFKTCSDYGIPADQASLLSMYIRNMQARLDTHVKDDIQIHNLIKLMNVSNQTLTEPIFAELNTFCNQKADTELTIKQIIEEKAFILEQSEKSSTIYVYLLLGLTAAQFIIFYWTIFQVDWLGRLQ